MTSSLLALYLYVFIRFINYHLFDIYEGENVGKDEKSLAYSIRFRAKDRTLEDKDVSAVMDKILKKLENLGVTLRQ